MSNALSIAAVTAIVKDLLENGLVDDAITTTVGDVIVTALPPDRISVGGDERPQLNLFLYQVTQNRNADWVSGEFRHKQIRPPAESRVTNPPLALNLHYLLTAYGAKDFQAELLLGYAMHLLHKTPVMSRTPIETALANVARVGSSSSLSQALTSMAIAELAQQIGQIKISPEFFSMEDTSKLWSSLQTHYRPSAAYQVSMICIDSNSKDKSSGHTLPARHEPKIDEIVPPVETNGQIVAGSALILRGQRLQSNLTRIRISGVEKLIEPRAVQDRQISLLLPANLSAGLHAIQVVHLAMQIPPLPAQEVTSNLVAAIVQPKITTTIDRVHQDEDRSYTAEITVQFYPLVRKGQQVVLLLDEITDPPQASYTIPVANPTDDTDSIVIPVKQIQGGNYWVRVQVNGAESYLSRNQQGEYDLPRVKIL
jgi:hypothetical protein